MSMIPEYHATEDGRLVCDECGKERIAGEWPWCPHGDAHAFGDDPIEPYVDVQLLDRKDPRCTAVNELGMRGVPIHSRSERRALMKTLGLQYGSQKFDDRGKKKYFT